MTHSSPPPQKHIDSSGGLPSALAGAVKSLNSFADAVEASGADSAYVRKLREQAAAVDSMLATPGN